MLALRMRQKDAEFYFVSYPAEDLLQRVKFETRFYGDRGEVVGGGAPDENRREQEADDVERFVRAIERSSGAFQRELNRRKVRQIRDFYRNETDQPIVPGAVLLFTPEQLKFSRLGQYEQMGDLAMPRAPFLIIDGQHRLAGLNFYLREPDADRRVEVPCVIFDGKTADFATEMFVIINSTHTRINKSHIVDLYERIEWGTDPHKKMAAQLVQMLYSESDSPLRYHINMLGGRSQRDMWINQAQLYGEVHRFVTRDDCEAWTTDGRGLARDRAYGFLRDVLRAARTAFGDAWGDNKRYMVTRDVTLKALVRVAGDAAASARTLLGLKPPVSGDAVEKAVGQHVGNWSAMVPEFRRDGFYERFAARGQVERVEKIRSRLSRAPGF
jgi:DGQHR domain-containing protein